jgi:L-aminopeptidase/D-esterase-like protein
MNNSITDVPGMLVGHDTDLEHGTGCTVILCPPEGAVAGVDVRGPAPGTLGTDTLRTGRAVERVHGIVLTGGSAFGLASVDGVMRCLEEKNIGLQVGVARVPIVAGAVIFDLTFANQRVRPTSDSGYRAARAAAGGSVAEGNIGAGTGATVGKILGMQYAMKGGLGTASQKIGNDVIVAALMVVNAVGDVVDPCTGAIIAGARSPNGTGFLDSASAIKQALPPAHSAPTNTTIGVVATNAGLTKEQANIVAMMAHNGIARAIRPAHMLLDGDTVFALSAGSASGDINAIGHTASEVVAEAIVRAVKAAQGLHGVPSLKEWASKGT